MKNQSNKSVMRAIISSALETKVEPAAGNLARVGI
jgi:hypothetical protein